MIPQEAQVGVGVLWMVIGIGGFLIVLLISVVGFFLKKIFTEIKNDVKNNTENIGKLKGSIELVEQQQIADTKRIEAMTQLELRLLSTNVSDLTKTVNTFVGALIKKGVDDK